MIAYFIPGVGANETAFSKIGEIGIEKVAIPWIAHEEGDTIESYAQKLIRKYKIGPKDITMGLSFGGLLAQEIAAQLGHREVVLLSSFQSIKHLRGLFQFGLKFGLNNMLPNVRTPIVDEFVALYLNAGSPDSKATIKQMTLDVDHEFMKWCIAQIAVYHNEVNENIIAHNIIGNSDKILKLWKNEHTHIIDGGSHFMVYEKADEITPIIKEIVAEVK